jgi:DNA-binding GntR family transcriptional regulator
MARKKVNPAHSDDLHAGGDAAFALAADPATDAGAESTDLRVRMREDTISGVLAPGQRLKLDELRGRYNASVGSLREALVQLVSEGFVTAESNRGFCVSMISLKDLDDITNMRVDLERKAITQSLQEGDDQWEADLVAAYHMLTKAVGMHESPVGRRIWWERHNAFHEALVSACPSVWLLRFRETLFDHSHRYRTLAIQQSASPGRLEEHRELMEAALARDIGRTSGLIEDHIRKTAENVRRWFVSQNYK